jgi:hypothetical protein
LSLGKTSPQDLTKVESGACGLSTTNASFSRPRNPKWTTQLHKKGTSTFAAEIADIEREMREQAMGDWWAMNMAAVGDAGAQPAEQAKMTLVVYGDPPEAIQDDTKKVMFSGKTTDQNRPSFEKHLRRELSEFTGKDLSKDKATVVALKDLKHLQELLKSGSYVQVESFSDTRSSGRRVWSAGERHLLSRGGHGWEHALLGY